ncbi:MAG: T9SS type A sorting domain-containing protein [Bacteroidales bacterium]|nr:T9SS type A sorting domain-containing protein [Bacteroidales bacterium]
MSSSFAMNNIDIYNTQGILVYNIHPDGHRQELSLEGLPAGTYPVAISTFGGTTHKKLVVK